MARLARFTPPRRMPGDPTACEDQGDGACAGCDGLSACRTAKGYPARKPADEPAERPIAPPSVQRASLGSLAFEEKYRPE